MDIRKLFIYAGLAVSTYLLILAWNKDYGQPEQELAQTANAVEQQAPSDTPDVSQVQPSAKVDQPQVADNDAPVQKQTYVDGLISVDTDVLQVKIDPRGGEVVEVKLPKYPTSTSNKDNPFTLLERSQRRTYVAQSGLVGANGVDKKGGVRYQTEKTEYTLADGQDALQVVLSTTEDDVVVQKIFTFKPNVYYIDVVYRVSNNSGKDWRAIFYAQIKRDGSTDPSAGSQMGMQSYLGAALTRAENRYEKVSFSDLDDGQFKSREKGGWASMLQHYFLTAWIANPETEHTYNGRKVKGNYIFGFYDDEWLVADGDTAQTGARLYVGPKIQKDLATLAEHLDLTIDFGWLWFLAQPLFWLLDNIHEYVGNWGIAIILLTVLIKAAFFRLSASSYRSMANMRKFAPKMQQIRERHGDNREKLGQEMMALYKKEKINPLGGCLPMLIQMPVFIALYWVLLESVELRQAPFFLWIEDMSVKDPYFILPLLMGLSMFIQMRLNPAPPDPMQAKVMQMMPVVFTVFFLWFPSGLVLYWVVNNILSIAQQYIITKRIESEAS